MGPSGRRCPRRSATIRNILARLYLGTADGHVFGSADAGEHWQLLGRVERSAGRCPGRPACGPARFANIVRGPGRRTPRRVAGFQERRRRPHLGDCGLRGQAVRALAQAPSDPDGSLRALSRASLLRAMREFLGAASLPNPMQNCAISIRLAVDPRRPEILYAGTFHLPWKSSDGGKTWTPIHTGMIDDSDVMSILVDLGESRRIYASACSGIYRSDNGAAVVAEDTRAFLTRRGGRMRSLRTPLIPERFMLGPAKDCGSRPTRERPGSDSRPGIG